MSAATGLGKLDVTSNLGRPRNDLERDAVESFLLSDVPEDTDVFHVLTRQPSQPEFIGTSSGKFYEISTDGTIREKKK